MPMKEKLHRNKAILKLYKPKEFGYKKVGKALDIDWTIVRRVVKREEHRIKDGQLSTLDR